MVPSICRVWDLLSDVLNCQRDSNCTWNLFFIPVHRSDDSSELQLKATRIRKMKDDASIYVYNR